jgi:hypothetical protein
VRQIKKKIGKASGTQLEKTPNVYASKKIKFSKNNVVLQNRIFL